MRTFALALSSVALASAHGGKGMGKKKNGLPVMPVAQSPVEFNCPHDFELRGMSCVKECIEPLRTFCPDGELRGDECVNFCPPDMMCPGGTIRRGNMCASTVTMPFDWQCPPGYDMSGGYQCSRELVQPPRLVCPAGSEPYGDQCVGYRTVEPLVSCGPGTNMINGACISTRQYECGIQGKHGKKGGHKRYLKAKGGKGKHDKKDYDFIPVPVVEVVSQQCQETVAHPPVITCPAGSEMYAGSCRIAEFCDFVEHYVPSIFDTTAAMRTCPLGFMECGGGKHGKKGLDGCCRMEEIPAEPYCPPGWSDVGGQCMEILPAQYSCSPGFFRRGDYCVMEEIVPPVGAYTVTYQCEGAGCGGYEGKAKKKGGKH